MARAERCATSVSARFLWQIHYSFATKDAAMIAFLTSSLGRKLLIGAGVVELLAERGYFIYSAFARHRLVRCTASQTIHTRHGQAAAAEGA